MNSQIEFSEEEVEVDQEVAAEENSEEISEETSEEALEVVTEMSIIKWNKSQEAIDHITMSSQELPKDTMMIMIYQEEEEEVSEASEAVPQEVSSEEEVKALTQSKISRTLHQEAEASEVEEVASEKALPLVVKSTETDNPEDTMTSKINKTDHNSNHRESSENPEEDSEVDMVLLDKRDHLKIDNNSQEVISRAEEAEAVEASEVVSTAPEEEVVLKAPEEEVASEATEEANKHTMTETELDRLEPCHG